MDSATPPLEQFFLMGDAMSPEVTNGETYTNGGKLAHMTVASEAEGAVLGHVSHIICSRTDKAFTGIGFRENIFKEEYMIPISAVKQVGRDLLIIDSESSIKPLLKSLPESEMFLKSMVGTAIATHAGNILGKIFDLGVNRNWQINRLYFDNHQWLDVSPESLTIGIDQILVPAGSTDRITDTKPEGWSLTKAFEKETYEHLGDTIQRSFRRNRSEDKTKSSDSEKNS